VIGQTAEDQRVRGADRADAGQGEDRVPAGVRERSAVDVAAERGRAEVEALVAHAVLGADRGGLLERLGGRDRGREHDAEHGRRTSLLGQLPAGQMGAVGVGHDADLAGRRSDRDLGGERGGCADSERALGADLVGGVLDLLELSAAEPDGIERDGPRPALQGGDQHLGTGQGARQPWVDGHVDGGVGEALLELGFAGRGRPGGQAHGA